MFFNLSVVLTETAEEEKYNLVKFVRCNMASEEEYNLVKFIRCNIASVPVVELLTLMIDVTAPPPRYGLAAGNWVKMHT